MMKKYYWLILLNPLFLLVYALGLETLSRFFRWGGVARRLPLIALLGGAGILWFVIWTIIYFRKKKGKVEVDKETARTKQGQKQFAVHGKNHFVLSAFATLLARAARM